MKHETVRQDTVGWCSYTFAVRIRWDAAEKMLADPDAFLAELKDARCALPLSVDTELKN